MGNKGTKWGIRKIAKDELKPFERAIDKAVDDLDHALRMYYITLQEFGIDDIATMDQMQTVFKKAIKKLGS